MGKKSKRGAASALVQRPQAGVVMNNRAVCRAVNELWERTQGSVTDSLPALWQEYEFVTSMTKVIKEKQGATPLPLPDRREKFDAFEKWLAEYKAIYTDQVEITEYPESGFGLRAKKDIKVEEKVMVIPDKLMMNSLTARDGLLGKLIAQDRILQMMHNVALSLHLLNERYAAEESFWKPYIDVLPHTFSTPFYFNKAELHLLQGSPTLVKALQQIRNVAKLFAHLHRLIRSHGDPALPIYKVGFYFNDFVWAVSSVMSRQNEIPLGITPGVTLALIPLWDFANHTQGHMTTFFDVENRLCECFAQQDVKAGEEFKIFYGARNNSDLFVHQGFVYPDNQHDYIPIKLGLSSAESSKTRALKERLLREAELAMPGTFKLLAMGDPFTNELRFVVRIFTASHEQLQQFFNEKGELVGVGRLLVPWQPFDDKALDFLEKRCQLLLQAYKTTIEEDNALLSGGGAKQLSLCSVVAIKIRLSEKKILYNAALFARTLRENLLTQPLLAEVQSQNGGSEPEVTQLTGNMVGAMNSEPVIVELDSEESSEIVKQPTGNMVGAMNSEPVIVELDSEESSEMVKQSTGNMVGAMNSEPVIVELDGEESSEIVKQPTGNAMNSEPVIVELDSEESSKIVKQPTENLAGAMNSEPVIVELNSEASSETSVSVEPKETVDSQQKEAVVQVNDEVGNAQSELSGGSKEKSVEEKREAVVSDSLEGGEKEREDKDQEVVVMVKGSGGGKDEGRGGGCHGDEGGGGGVLEKTGLEQTTQCVNGNE